MTANAIPQPTPASPGRRILAGLLAFTLLLTALGAVSPELHHWLHPDGDHHHSATCAVALLATGVTLGTTTVATAPPQVRACVVVYPPECAPLITRRYLHPPGHGPPVV